MKVILAHCVVYIVICVASLRTDVSCRYYCRAAWNTDAV